MVHVHYTTDRIFHIKETTMDIILRTKRLRIYFNNELLTTNVGNPNPTVYKTNDVTVDSLNGYLIDSSWQKNPL